MMEDETWEVTNEVWESRLDGDELAELGKVCYLLTKYSDSETYEEAIEEWNEVELVEAANTSKCICGQNIEKQYFVKNACNGNVLCLGSDCIETLGNEILTDSVRILKKTEKESTKHRICGCCLKLRIGVDEPTFKHKCRECYSNGEEYKQAYKNLNFLVCEGCECKEIPSGSKWKVRFCDDCKKDRSDQNRKCNFCKENTVNFNAPKWDNICFDCKKKSGKVPCPQCGEEKIWKVEQKWRKSCTDCWKAQNK